MSHAVSIIDHELGTCLLGYDDTSTHKLYVAQYLLYDHLQFRLYQVPQLSYLGTQIALIMGVTFNH